MLQTKRQDFARGIADGLQVWSQREATRQGLVPPPLKYPTINIIINNQTYKDKGIFVNGNACVPVDLLKPLGIDLALLIDTTQINYRNVIYVKAVDLQIFNVSVQWDNSTRSVVLRKSGLK